MEKIIIIDGKQIKFKSNGATPLRFKAQFAKDFFKEILKLLPLAKLADEPQTEFDVKNLEILDFEVFYQIAWTMAKTANSTIPEPVEWLEQFDEFPLAEIIPELQELMLSAFQTTKKK